MGCFGTRAPLLRYMLLAVAATATIRLGVAHQCHDLGNCSTSEAGKAMSVFDVGRRLHKVMEIIQAVLCA